jgi:hypothetical protein
MESIQSKRYNDIIKTPNSYICSMLYYTDQLFVVKTHYEEIKKYGESEYLNFYKNSISNKENYIQWLRCFPFITQLLSKNMCSLVRSYLSKTKY